MQLHVARLCLDCQEVHAESRCPACASESFAPVSRWIPPDERRTRARPEDRETAEAYKRLLAPTAPTSRAKWVPRTALVLATVGLGWLWRQSSNARSTEPE